MTTEQFERRTGVFRPQRTDDLKPGSEEWVDREMTWEAVWVIEEGPYEGEWAWSHTARVGEPHPPFIWVPERDLDFSA